MAIQNQIKEQLKDAMRAKDSVRLNTLRSILTAFTNELVARGHKPDEEIPDDDALAVLQRAAKQRKDSIEQFEKGGRADLAENEKKELAIIESYLPQMMGEEEIEPVVKAKMEALGVTDKSGMGKLIGAVMSELKGRADGADVKSIVERLLI